MQSRAVIEQAKGIVMATWRCTGQHAFDVLVELSQTSNRRLRDVAQALVDDALPARGAHDEGRPPEDRPSRGTEG